MRPSLVRVALVGPVQIVAVFMPLPGSRTRVATAATSTTEEGDAMSETTLSSDPRTWSVAALSKWFETYRGGEWARHAPAFATLDGSAMSSLPLPSFQRRVPGAAGAALYITWRMLIGGWSTLAVCAATSSVLSCWVAHPRVHVCMCACPPAIASNDACARRNNGARGTCGCDSKGASG